MKKLKLAVLLMLLGHLFLHGQQAGSMIIENINAPSLENSVIGEPAVQPIAVYLPPTYYSNTLKRYPVVYFLPGYEDTIAAYTKGYINGYVFESSMNSNITQGRLKEVIMVIVNGFNLLEGCIYQNSPVTGNWEDFVVNDVVTYIDNTYRTIPNSDSRAIIGLSMGGYGALHLSMRHPSVFSIGVGECPGLASPTGMMETSLFNDNNVIRRIISIRKNLEGYSKAEAQEKYIDTIYHYRRIGDWITLFSFAYGSAFAPDTNLNAPYFKYPFSIDINNNIVKDTTTFKLYEAGFGNLMHKLELYKDSLLKLNGYAADYGTNDYFRWIVNGNRYYDSLLTANEIPHRTWINTGGHGDLHKSRTEYIELPYCDSILVFDNENLNTGADIEKFSISAQQTAEPIIDLVNKEIHITFKTGTNLTAVNPVIYLSPGAKISPEQGKAIDFSSGVVTYTVTSEDGNNIVAWNVYSSITGMGNPVQLNRKLEIFPNPANNSFIVKDHENRIRKVEILDLSGRIVEEVYANNSQVLIERDKFMVNGAYLVKAYNKDGLIASKILLLD